MNSKLNFLKQFLKSSQSLLFFGTLVFYFFSMNYPIYEHAGNIYYGGNKYAFWDINSYAKEQNIKMNDLSNDDFKLIDMINI